MLQSFSHSGIRRCALAIALLVMGVSFSHAQGCPLNSPSGNIKHVIYVQFDNTHFTRDNPNVPSDLEQMPNLLNFLETRGTLLSNHHTPLPLTFLLR